MPELQNNYNRQVNRGLRVINIILFFMLTAAIVVALTTYRNVQHLQNTTLVGPGGAVIGPVTLIVPNWVIIPAKVEYDAHLRLPTGTEVSASPAQTAVLGDGDVTLLKADGIPAELLLNGAALADDARVYVQDDGVEWVGHVRKDADGVYRLNGDRQFSLGLPVVSDSDRTAVVGVIASSRSGPLVVSIEQLQQLFPQLK